MVALLAIGAIASFVMLTDGSRPVGSENLIGRPLPGFAAPLASGVQDADSNIYTAAEARAARSVAACDVKLPGVFNSCRDLKGTAILTFWNSTKGQCTAQIAQLDRFARGRKGLKVAAVAFDESAADVREYVARQPWKLPVPIDRDGATAGLYAVAGCPSTFFVKDGTVTAVKLGRISDQQLEAGLKAAASSTGSTSRAGN